MNLIIRDAKSSDYKEVALLSVESYQEYSQSLTSENWDKMKTNLSNLSNVSEVANQAKLIVAEQNDRLVGSVFYYPPGTSSPRLFQPQWSSIRMLAVVPQYRGHQNLSVSRYSNTDLH